MLDHEKELEDQNIQYLKNLQDEQMNSNKREDTLKNQLEFLRTSFHSYKVKFLLLFCLFFRQSKFFVDQSR